MFFFHLPAGIQQYNTLKNIEFIKYGMEHSVTQFKSWINVRNMTANLSFKTFQLKVRKKVTPCMWMFRCYLTLADANSAANVCTTFPFSGWIKVVFQYDDTIIIFTMCIF